MGCDIHYFFEKLDFKGKWKKINTPEKFEINRNYAIFTVLANVRTIANLPIISEPRGIPEDHIELQKEYDDSYFFHNASWLLVKELLNYNWDIKHPDSWRIQCFKKEIQKLNILGPSDKVRIVFMFDN